MFALRSPPLHLVDAGLVIFLLLLVQAFQAAPANGGKCAPSSCGEIPIIKYPFRLTTDPQSCGDHNHNLSCESNRTVLYQANSSARFFVQAIDYEKQTIRLVDDAIVIGNCSSFPTHPLSWWPFPDVYSSGDLNAVLTLVSCDNPVVSSSTKFMETAPCINRSTNSSPYYYAISDRYFSDVDAVDAFSLPKNCRVEMMTMFMLPTRKNHSMLSFQQVHLQLEYGFQLSWHPDDDRSWTSFIPSFIEFLIAVICPGVHFLMYGPGVQCLKYVALARMPMTVLGTPLVIAFLIYKWRRRHLSAYDNIEEFLKQNHNLMPIRYSYSNIKKFTGNFKDKLGEGGFGSVYKGKLRSGGFAAVKMLGKSTAGGVQDFINEVATIGRIHHANVVRLVGFCSEASKRALVYEFMPNGSLDKYIFHKKQGCTATTLTLEQLYRISIGVARGIEYLHEGCAMQILHFDIKPHNILLDDSFIPKLSDFGLAKLHRAGDRVATLTAVRGTIGYMAPELFYKNIGSVSYKVDVYSFGMLLLDMAEKRNNLNAEAGHSSQLYFPFWVHDQVSTPGTPILAGDNVTEEDIGIAKKMVIVGLWCIQTNPDDRPPMNRVVEMLEGDLESLPLPPRPAMFAGESVVNIEEEGSSSFYVSSQYTQSIGQSSNEH